MTRPKRHGELIDTIAESGSIIRQAKREGRSLTADERARVEALHARAGELETQRNNQMVRALTGADLARFRNLPTQIPPGPGPSGFSFDDVANVPANRNQQNLVTDRA